MTGLTRLILTFRNPALEGVLRIAQRAGAPMTPARQNWVGPGDLDNLLLAMCVVAFRKFKLAPRPTPTGP